MNNLLSFKTFWMILLVIVFGMQYVGSADNALDGLRNGAIGYGSGNSPDEALENAKLDAIKNSGIIKMAVSETLDSDNNFEKVIANRGACKLGHTIIIEKGEDFTGQYMRIKAEVLPIPITYPIGEAIDQNVSYHNNDINAIRDNLLRGLDGSREVTVTGMGNSRGAAIRQAYKNAIEAGVGRCFFDYAFEMSNDEVITNRYISIANGYISSYTIEKEEENEQTGAYKILMKANVIPGGVVNKPLEELSTVQRETLAWRNAEVLNLLKIELDNMKSIMPYLYECTTDNVTVLSDTKVKIDYSIKINENVYYNLFIPRLLQIMSAISEQKPVELRNIGTYNVSDNSVSVSKPDKNADPYGITIVDQGKGCTFTHALNFTLTPEIKRIFQEWRRQVFAKSDIQLEVFSQEGVSCTQFSTSAKSLHNTPIPYYAKGWGSWYNDLWLPVLSDDNAVMRGSVKVKLRSAPNTTRFTIKPVRQMPCLDMNMIMAARNNTEPTTSELLLSFFVRLGLALIALLCLIIIIAGFSKHAVLGFILLCLLGSVGGYAVYLIFL